MNDKYRIDVFGQITGENHIIGLGLGVKIIFDHQTTAFERIFEYLAIFGNCKNIGIKV